MKNTKVSKNTFGLSQKYHGLLNAFLLGHRFLTPTDNVPTDFAPSKPFTGLEISSRTPAHAVGGNICTFALAQTYLHF